MNDVQSLKAAYIIEGVLLMILGMIGIVFPVLYTYATELFLGSLLVAAGIVQLYRAFKSVSNRGFFIGCASAILTLVIGGLLIVFPSKGVLSLTALLMVFFLIGAILKWMVAAQMKQAEGAGWMFLSGFLSFAMAAIIFFGWPGSAFWVIGLFVGIDLLFTGAVLAGIGWNIGKRA